MSEQRVSDERLAEILTEPCGNTARALVADLRDARARLAAWEPAVRAGMAWSAAAYQDSGEGPAVNRAEMNTAENALLAAIDALPDEHRP